MRQLDVGNIQIAKGKPADGSVGSPHVRVGHRQALNRKGRIRKDTAFLFATLVMTFPVIVAGNINSHRLEAVFALIAGELGS
jgi:hypothetical protein